MKKIFQDGPANCFQACIASLLELQLNDVPDFVGLYGNEWFNKCNEWLNKRGLNLIKIPSTFFEINNCSFHYIDVGPSPRIKDGYHAVISFDNKMVHDPHPDNTGLKNDVSISVYVLVSHNPQYYMFGYTEFQKN